MALSGVLRVGLGLLTKGNAAAASVGTWQHVGRGMSTDAPSKKDIVHFLDAREDPDVDAAIRAYQRAAYKSKAAPEKPEPTYELSSQVERKYVAAQIVETGIQNIAVPLTYKTEGVASVKRYVAQLLSLGSKAGFECPATEVIKRASGAAASADTVKELLAGLKTSTTPEFHAALVEAATAVEAETGAAVTLDGASNGYKKFAARVAKAAEAAKLPVNLLVNRTKAGEEGAKARRDFAVWVQQARVSDASAELEVLKAEATAALDKHLSKSADAIRKEQAAALASLQKRIESAKGAAWAEAYKKDLEALSAWDSAVSADPVNGPKISVSA